MALSAFLTSFHEFIHKITDSLGLEDNLDLLQSIFDMAIKEGKLRLGLFFQNDEVIYFDESGKPYVMRKINEKWTRIEFDPWQLKEF